VNLIDASISAAREDAYTNGYTVGYQDAEQACLHDAIDTIIRETRIQDAQGVSSEWWLGLEFAIDTLRHLADQDR
jgi:hypothetical protein